MTKRTKNQLKDIAVRAFKTFLQAFIASLVLVDDPLEEQALIGALAAGLSALWNSRQLILASVKKMR